MEAREDQNLGPGGDLFLAGMLQGTGCFTSGPQEDQRPDAPDTFSVICLLFLFA